MSEWVDPDVVQDMSLADMRSSLSILVTRKIRSAHSLNEIHSDPPEGLDTELLLPLAWKWSWDYANICMEQHEAGQENESSDRGEAGSPLVSDSEGEE